MSEKEFKGKTALVTGSARGIGRAIAEDLAEWGADQVILDMDQKDCDQTASEIASKYGVKAIGIACNVTNKEQVDQMAAKVKSEMGGLSFLVNNAGILRDNLLLRMDEKDWDMVLDVNLKGPFLVTQALLRLLIKAEGGGRLVNISSVSGLVGQAGQANYSSSKSGLIGFTKVVAREYASRGLLANAICPGYVQTDLTGALPDDVQKMLEESIPLGRPGRVKDISRVVRFLCSDDASFMTGNVIRVDGGTAIGM